MKDKHCLRLSSSSDGNALLPADECRVSWFEPEAPTLRARTSLEQTSVICDVGCSSLDDDRSLTGNIYLTLFIFQSKRMMFVRNPVTR
jgi:hypothetical protein